MSIRDKYGKILKRKDAAKRQRNPEDVKLMAVTKKHEPDEPREATMLELPG